MWELMVSFVVLILYFFNMYIEITNQDAIKHRHHKNSRFSEKMFAK